MVGTGLVWIVVIISVLKKILLIVLIKLFFDVGVGWINVGMANNVNKDKTMKKLFFIIALGLGLLLIWLWIYFYFFFNLLWECSEEIFQTIKIENQKEVIGILVNCGATSDYATQYYIVEWWVKSDPLVTLKGAWGNKCSVEFENNTLNITCTDIKESAIFSIADNYKWMKINFHRL